jgi:hypothetical protein
VVYVIFVIGKSIYFKTLLFLLTNTKMKQVVLSKSGIVPAGQNLIKHSVHIKIYVKWNLMWTVWIFRFKVMWTITPE